MDILVCIKRVPTVGGKIAVTADGQEVDTRASGFSISPHEECAVEGCSLLVEYMGEHNPVTVAVAGATPLFDPSNERVRS